MLGLKKTIFDWKVLLALFVDFTESPIISYSFAIRIKEYKNVHK